MNAAVATPSRMKLPPLVLLALLAGPLLSMMDGNVVNVAIPDIVRERRASLTSVQWVVSGYLLALAATLPLAMNLIFESADMERFPVSAGLVLFLGPALGHSTMDHDADPGRARPRPGSGDPAAAHRPARRPVPGRVAEPCAEPCADLGEVVPQNGHASDHFP
jgi:hypothetical protein